MRQVQTQLLECSSDSEGEIMHGLGLAITLKKSSCVTDNTACMLEQFVEDCWVLTLNGGKRLY